MTEKGEPKTLLFVRCQSCSAGNHTLPELVGGELAHHAALHDAEAEVTFTVAVRVPDVTPTEGTHP